MWTSKTKKCLLILVSVFFWLPCGNAASEDIPNAEIIRELQAMKARLDELEKEIRKRDEKIKELEDKTLKTEQELAHTRGHAAGRVPMEPVAEAGAEKAVPWTEKIKLSGLIEVEGSSERIKTVDPAQGDARKDKREDNITLATVELGAEAQVNKYVTGSIRLLYEQDETDLTIDEGTVTVGGIEETFGFYGLAGRYYPHFGGFNSWLVSDPLTLEIFEIRETAAQIGWKSDWLTTGVGAFRGDIRKLGEEEGRIKGYFGDVHFHNPEGTWRGLAMVAGASYLNNVGESDTLQGQDGLDGRRIKDRIPGVAFYMTAEYDRFSLGAEFITALDSFEAGEMNYALDSAGNPRESRPSAWNLELAFRPLERMQLAARYEGTKDMFGLYPRSQFGLCVSYRLLEGAVISGEYLHGKYESDNRNADGVGSDTRDLFTTQLAVEF